MTNNLYIIALSGKMRRGKDTVAEYLEKKYSFQKVAFGNKLKDICMNYDNKAKKNREMWNYSIAKDLYPDCNQDKAAEKVDKLMQNIQPGTWKKLKYEECYGEKTEFSRRVMQQIGEGARNVLKQDKCWVHYLLRSCQQKGGRFAICDMRYRNEAFEVILASPEHQQVWRIERDMPKMSGANHISETDLDEFPFEVIIQNDGTIEELYEQVDSYIVPFLAYRQSNYSGLYGDSY